MKEKNEISSLVAVVRWL